MFAIESSVRKLSTVPVLSQILLAINIGEKYFKSYKYRVTNKDCHCTTVDNYPKAYEIPVFRQVKLGEEYGCVART
jgi:hypothetical protein